MSEIMFIAPYEELAEIALQVCRQESNIVVKMARMEQAVQLAKEAEKKGFQVIVSRGVTSDYIKRSQVELPVVDVIIGGYDILRAYYQAKELGGPIGIVDVDEVIQGITCFEEVIEEKLIKYTCQNELDDIHRGIEYLRKQGAKVVIGKIAMAQEAKKYGLDSVIITSGLETVARAVAEAKRVNEVRKQVKRKEEQLKAILDFTYDGIIALDEKGMITVFNRAAEQLSGWKAENVIGNAVTDIIPKANCQNLLRTGRPELGEILEIGKAKVVVNRVPIIVDHKPEGVVTTFQPIDKFQKLESKIRKELAERGLIAKYSFEDLLGDSIVFQDAIDLAKEYAAVDSTVLLLGRTGSGKEMFAHAIHNDSHRKNEPFVAINCAALPESILESELFGYVEGAFTGARKGGKAGVFEMAHRGTLFLDEVGEMSPMLQARILRVIEQGEIMRLGDNSILPVNVRLVAATHRDLEEMVTKKEFREDLYYRLNVLALQVPPLQERGRDILLIANKMLQEFCKSQGKILGKFTHRAEEILLEYHWPGNIRELRNAMERLSIISGTIIGEKEVEKALFLPLRDHKAIRNTPMNGGLHIDSMETGMNHLLDKKMDSYERELILKTIQECHGNKTEAAQRLGMSRTTLWRKLKNQ